MPSTLRSASLAANTIRCHSFPSGDSSSNGTGGRALLHIAAAPNQRASAFQRHQNKVRWLTTKETIEWTLSFSTTCSRRRSSSTYSPLLPELVFTKSLLLASQNEAPARPSNEHIRSTSATQQKYQRNSSNLIGTFCATQWSVIHFLSEPLLSSIPCYL